jgi:amidase
MDEIWLQGAVGPANVGRDALDITRRYWEWNELEGGKSVQLLADWDRFRTDMLTFMESVEIILCPTAPASRAPPR